MVVKKYLSLLASRTRVILVLGQSRPRRTQPRRREDSRWVGEVRGLGIACDGDNLTIGDTFFTVCPWWDGPLVKQRIEDQLRDASAKRLKRWVWVHHAPPANSPTSWGGKRFFGDVELVQWIERYQPSMVISGHVHQSPFIPDGSWFDRLGDTWVFNAGLQPGRPPVFIVLDIDDNSAFWLSAEAAQSIDLGAPLQRPAAPIKIAPRWLTSLVGLPIRACETCDGGRLIMLCRSFADHREVTAVAGILMHDVARYVVATLRRCANSRATKSATCGWSRRNEAASSISTITQLLPVLTVAVCG